jgi:hypothetical protein
VAEAEKLTPTSRNMLQADSALPVDGEFAMREVRRAARSPVMHGRVRSEQGAQFVAV